METYDSFTDIMNIMVLMFVAAAIILGIVVLYNLGIMSYVERSRELATLKALLATLGDEYELKLRLGALTYSVSLLVTFGVSLAVSFLVSRKNKKIDMVEALK